MILSGDTMEAVVKPAQRVWNTWGMHVLVLLSFTIQVTLLIFGEIRQRKKSAVVRAITWSAYMLADTLAVYTLGHFYFIRSAEHELMVLWAPMLLVHLGGQDNINAYALEDNKLWLRHLQNLGVQVIAAAYVLYQSSILSRPTWLRAATILMFVVGVLKYGERVLALKRASGATTTRFLRVFREKNWEQGADKVYQKIQVKLSWLYNILYGKASLISSLYTLCIRVICLLATVLAFIVFHRAGDKDGLNNVDVTATYILLVGALVLEITVLRFVFPCIRMLRCAEDHQPGCLEDLIYWCMQKAGMHTMRSGSMGQLDLLDMCSRTRDSRLGQITTWMEMWGWWIRLDLCFSWSIPIPTEIIQLLMEAAGEHLDRSELELRFEDLTKRGVPTEEKILVCHIATHVYLKWYKQQQQADGIFAKATEALSNYALFLLAAHPLPDVTTGLPHDIQMEGTCTLKYVMNYVKDRSRGESLMRSIRNNTYMYMEEELSLSDGCWHAVTLLEEGPIHRAFHTGFQTGVKMTSNDGMGGGKSLVQSWVNMLKTVEGDLGDDFHLKQLSNGGEFLTFLALLPPKIPSSNQETV